MGKIELEVSRQSYVERPQTDDPRAALERAQAKVRAERLRRERLLITAPRHV